MYTCIHTCTHVYIRSHRNGAWDLELKHSESWLACACASSRLRPSFRFSAAPDCLSHELKEASKYQELNKLFHYHELNSFRVFCSSRLSVYELNEASESQDLENSLYYHQFRLSAASDCLSHELHGASVTNSMSHIKDIWAFCSFRLSESQTQ